MSRMIRATDFYLLKQCNRQVYLDHHGNSSLFRPVTGYFSYVVRQGNEFEQQVVESFGVMRAGKPGDTLYERAQMTLDYMRQGVAAIYQAVLMQGDLVGSPDLILRVPGASKFGAYQYRPVDIKSTQTSEEEHRLQVMAYIALLEAVQGTRTDGGLLLRIPAHERVNGALYREEIVRYDDEVYQRNLAEVRDLVMGLTEPRPFMSSTCGKCGWQQVCRPIADAQQDVSLLPGIQRRVWDQLHERGMGTVSAVAAARPEALMSIKGIGEKSALQMIRQAQAQHSGQMIRIAAPSIKPSQMAVFFDIESLPSEGLYYLMGTAFLCDGEVTFSYDLAESAADEARMWDSFLSRMDALDCPVYHYGQYERSAIKKMMERYGSDARAHRLLDRLIDLERVLKECAALPLRGYSLKDIAPWLGFKWTGRTQGAEDSMLEYLHWLSDGDTTHLHNILQYNEDDCTATRVIYEWLLTLR